MILHVNVFSLGAICSNFYWQDVGYPNTVDFLAPFKKTIYYLLDFLRVRRAKSTAHETPWKSHEPIMFIIMYNVVKSVLRLNGDVDALC